MDGIAHPCYVNIGRDGKGLPWKAGEWHHVAFSWTGHTIWFWGDGKLLGKLYNPVPFRIGRNEGRLDIGFPRLGFGRIAGALIDELRVCDVPLYVGEGSPPRPEKPISADLGLGLAFLGAGAKARANSTSPPERFEADVPQLHNGRYGDAVRIGVEGGRGWAKVCLPLEAEVSAIEWSRDGRPYGGPKGQGWAFFMPLPLGFRVEVSLDGERWRTVLSVPNFEARPSFVASHTALRFRHKFKPVRARFVKFVITRAPRGYLPMLLDELVVLDPEGRNLALLPGAKVVTGMSSFERRYNPNFAIDGRYGEASCWKSGEPGRGVLTVELPKPSKVSRLTISSYRDWPKEIGVPTEGRIEA
ncbi:MAG TPA: hypothetical protein EYP90_03165, partial [Chromatiaceae bacterium]|nr:hypothetical protein [Chromatiaceae bacterium]